MGVLVDTDLSIRCAGGILLQLLPGALDSSIDTIENNIRSLPNISSLIDSGKNPYDIAELVFHGLPYHKLDDFHVEYKCTCSRERMERVLISLGKEELYRLADEQDNTEIICHFCGTKYHFSSEELKKLI